MILLLLPLAALAGAAFLSNQAPAPAPAPARAAAPSPLAIVSAYLARGETPPMQLIEFAVAEAKTIGRADVALALLERFVIPAFRRARVIDVPAAPAQIAAPPPLAIAPSSTDEDLMRAAMGERAPVSAISASPIAGVSPADWARFCRELAREPVSFAGPRHVGRYRHRKDRLNELGIDPAKIIGDEHAQDDALATDLADALARFDDGGELDDVIGKPVRVPHPSGALDEVPVTLSGVLGLASVAGLEGAAAWLEKESDRVRFPHTTAAFVRCNGVF